MTTRNQYHHSRHTSDKTPNIKELDQAFKELCIPNNASREIQKSATYSDIAHDLCAPQRSFQVIPHTRSRFERPTNVSPPRSRFERPTNVSPPRSRFEQPTNVSPPRSRFEQPTNVSPPRSRFEQPTNVSPPRSRFETRIDTSPETLKSFQDMALAAKPITPDSGQQSLLQKQFRYENPILPHLEEQRAACDHRTCYNIRNKGAKEFVAIAPILNHNKYGLVLGVGYQRFGPYENKYNICFPTPMSCEKHESDYHKGVFCWLRAAMRALKNTFKMEISFENGSFDKWFKNKNGKIRFFMHEIHKEFTRDQIPVFIAMLPNGTQRATITEKMRVDLNKANISRDRKEMQDFDWVLLSTGKQVENKLYRGEPFGLSSFANQVREKIDTALL